MVDWTSPVSALTGALIGISSTLLADRARWRRDRQDRRQAARREIYAEYLTALARTRNGLWEAAHSTTLSPGDRATKARDAFQTGGVYELHNLITITAPEALIPHSEAVFDCLRFLRDKIEQGAIHEDDAYLQHRTAYQVALQSLRRAIREDLGGDDA
ncbi:hypothetical protein [Streptomyces sp. HUAS ZL42]|uniref:hypothetical protein n=1 Tax=Streptomyces sp. HUAS ZL42 TaxID=3231715 RepID=UPI00345E682F